MGDLTRSLSIHEYLPKREYELYKAGKLPLRIIDYRLILADQKFIDRYGATVINNWYQGGDLEFCGYRPYDCKIGAKYSQHKHGRASDKHPIKTTWSEIAHDILKNKKLFFDMGFSVVEDIGYTSNWIHLEVGDNSRGFLQVVKP